MSFDPAEPSGRAFEYDAAFSFLERDQATALAMADRLRDRYKVFLYSEHQDRLAGADGEAELNKIFGEESRLVVVLYRNGWGESDWTRVEKTAIRNRMHGANPEAFLLVMPLDGTAPQWLPKYYLCSISSAGSARRAPLELGARARGLPRA